MKDVWCNMCDVANKRKAVLVASLLLVAFATGAAANVAQKDVCRILVVGDSISSGYGLSDHEGWVDQFRVAVQGIVPADIENLSRPGLTIDQAIQVTKEAAGSSYGVAILQVGSNDALVQRPADNIRRSLEKLLGSLNRSKVFLIGATVPADYDEEYRHRLTRVYEDIARDKKVILINIAFDQYLYSPEYLQDDRIHPNARGHRVILDAVIEAFNESGLGRDKSC